MNAVEIQIPVPWGHVAAKVWGNHTDGDYMALMVHGAMDNAGSFDRLVPLLPTSFCYICIDLPGHGKSSHFPPFFPIHTMNYVITLKLAVEYFKRKKYIIFGHSNGGHIVLWFTYLYPEYVEKLVLLDAVHFPASAERFSKNLKRKIDYAIAFHRKVSDGKRPTYIYTEALDILMNKRMPGLELTREAAEALLPRAVTVTENGKYMFTNDPRTKMHLSSAHDLPYTLEILQEFPSTCPVLLLRVEDSTSLEQYRKPMEAVFKKRKNLWSKTVEGNHDVHNNNPEVVAPHVADFMLKKGAKL